MKYRIDKTFSKDIVKINNKDILIKLKELLKSIEESSTLKDIPNLKKLKGYRNYYRIKIGDYRIGMELSSENELILILHRREIYRYFPKRN